MTAKSRQSAPPNKVESTEIIMESTPKYRVKQWQKRLLVGVPTTGSIRMEWAAAKYGMVVPANYSKVDMTQYLTSAIPLRYTIADAQNMIVNHAVTQGYEWLLLIEDDTMPPPDAYLRFNKYMRENKYPLVSGMYFTKSTFAEPMMYRGRGNSYYAKWKLGDLVFCDGVPTGMLLLNVKFLEQIYNDSEEYITTGQKLRRVFDTPVRSWFNEERGAQEAYVGTSDLDFCQRVIDQDYLKKLYPKLYEKQYPFPVDTNIACMHITPDGQQWPMEGIKGWCEKNGNL